MVPSGLDTHLAPPGVKGLASNVHGRNLPPGQPAMAGSCHGLRDTLRGAPCTVHHPATLPRDTANREERNMGASAKPPAKAGPEWVVTNDDKAPELPTYQPGTAWEQEAAYADSVAGHDLAKDETLDALEGVPFMITRVTFRPGIRDRKDKLRAYASCECVIAPESVLRRRRVDMSTLPFDPEDQVIFNDGSTGIYRQVVAYLAARGFITIPTELPEAGEYGQSRYDVPPWEWETLSGGEYRANDEPDADTGKFAEWGKNIRLRAPRGLRISEYATDYNPNGSRTRYLG